MERNPLELNPMNLPSFNRRKFIATAGGAAAAYLAGGRVRGAETITLPFANGERTMGVYPQKRLLIVQSSRPPQLETPFSVFREGVLTPNDAFFVRYHLAGIPTSIDPETYRLEIKGEVKTPLSLSLADLKSQFEPMELIAVNQCSGNSRGFSNPRVGGGQSANGAMGNARWRGVSLKSVLEKAGVNAGAKQVTADGLDRPVLEKTPDFIKALNMDHALDGEVMLAWEMNGEPLPMLNGFPLRLVVPGYFGTYWVKHLSTLNVVAEPLDNFWMSTAYRIPNTPGGCLEPGTAMKSSVPIARFKVRSFITSVADGDRIKTGQQTVIKGIAFDGGEGIQEVLFSADDGKTWSAAELGKDLGRYSFREWSIPFKPMAKGSLGLRCRAITRIGESQPMEPLWNPSGYMRNVVETVKLETV